MANLSQRLFAAFAAVLVIASSGGLVGYWVLGRTATGITVLQDASGVERAAADAATATTSGLVSLNRFLADGDAANIAATLRQLGALREAARIIAASDAAAALQAELNEIETAGRRLEEAVTTFSRTDAEIRALARETLDERAGELRGRIGTLLDEIEDKRNFESAFEVARVLDHFTSGRFYAARFLSDPTPEAADAVAPAFAKAREAMRTATEGLLSKQKVEARAIDAALKSLLADVTTVRDMMRQRDEIRRGVIEPLGARIVAVAGIIRDQVGASARESGARVTREAMQARLMVLLATALAILVALVIAFAAGRSVAVPLRRLRADMERLADGETTATALPPSRIAEIAGMAKAVDVFRGNARDLAAAQIARRGLDAAAGEARAATEAALINAVGAVVAAARSGDFSRRAEVTADLGGLAELVHGLNEVVTVVDAATADFTDAMVAIAAGDLTRRVDASYSGRFAELKEAVNGTISTLSGVVAVIQTTAGEVAQASREIHGGAAELSTRTEQEAARLEGTAASMEEIAGAVREAARYAATAVALAEGARTSAAEGDATVAGVAEAMGRIEQSSGRISAILDVINEIAFQTNLLALNAAVEAARAGEAGRGFAVVATEVRLLAQRSGDAAKDIASLIKVSHREVQAGTAQARDAAGVLARIVGASTEVVETIRSISGASQAQAVSLDALNSAIVHLDNATRQNAALAEESAAAATTLTGKVGELNDLVSTFVTAAPSPGARRRAA